MATNDILLHSLTSALLSHPQHMGTNRDPQPDNKQGVRDPGTLNPKWMSIKFLPSGLGNLCRSGGGKSQRGWPIPRKQGFLSITEPHTHELTGRGSMHRVCRGLHQIGSYLVKGNVDTRPHSERRSCLQLINIGN